ncbi:hypothetical protein CU098_004749 [Rhizopus stolonifer]|uniref:C2H2-type domain-containing protein n=1 Tax=Rhizopus stolonifer TaxID=4846 RepID=A0A367IJN2_RHIST|nr:hypothetical protein CU098_004749 [Rhizopus stolonifer]
MSSNNSVIFPSVNFSRSSSEHDLISLTSSSMDNNSFSTADDYYNTSERKPSILPYQDYDASVQQFSAMLPLLTPPSDSIYCQDPWFKRQSYMCDPYCCYSSASSYDPCCSYGNSSDSIASCYSPTCHECNLITPTESPSIDHSGIKNLLAFDQPNYFHPYNDIQNCSETIPMAVPSIHNNNSRKLRGYSKSKRQSSIDSTSSESELSEKPFLATAPRRYKCTVCPKRFTRPSSLATHMHSHTGEKPYECEHDGCGRRFSVVSNLRRHAKIHSHHS